MAKAAAARQAAILAATEIQGTGWRQQEFRRGVSCSFSPTALRAESQRLRPVNALSASKLLLQKQVPDHLPTPLANACRAVARQVLQVLEIDFTDHEDVEHISATEPLPATEMPLRLASGARRAH